MKTLKDAKRELFGLLMEHAPIPNGYNDIRVFVNGEYEHVVKHIKLLYNGRRVIFQAMKIIPINYDL